MTGKRARASRDPAVILAMVRAGRSNAEIAQQLGITTRTLDRWLAANPELRRAIKAIRDSRHVWNKRAPCGTTAAYQRHRRRNEPADSACLHANAEASRAKYARRKGTIDHYQRAPQCPRTRIEQAVARGLPTTRIMSELNVDYPTIKPIRDRMAS